MRNYGFVASLFLPLTFMITTVSARSDEPSTHKMTPVTDVNHVPFTFQCDEAYKVFHQAAEAQTKKNYSLALERYQRVLVLYPNCFPAHYNLGLCFEAQENWKSAYAEFQFAEKLQNLHRDLYKHLWFLAWKLELKDDANTYMKQYSQL